MPEDFILDFEPSPPVIFYPMNTDAVNAAFAKLISEKGVHDKLGISNSMVTSLRYNLKNGIPISTDKKMQLLQKSGWRQDDICYTTNDLVNVVKFALRQGAAAKEHGAEYLVEKFLAKRK